jgi:DNA-binding protein HU-beta
MVMIAATEIPYAREFCARFLTVAFRACYKEATASRGVISPDNPNKTKSCARPSLAEGEDGAGIVSVIFEERGLPVNKTELVEVVAKSAGISKVASEKAVDGTLNAIKSALKKGQSVTLANFGTFKVGKRAARLGRNPQTGAEIRIKAARVPKFSAGKALKDELN